MLSLQDAVNESVWWHDFDNIKFQSHIGINDLKELARIQLRNAYFFITLPKPILRGGIIGGGIGALVSYFSGDYPSQGAKAGAAFGAYIDSQVYLLRGLFWYFKSQISTDR